MPSIYEWIEGRTKSGRVLPLDRVNVYRQRCGRVPLEASPVRLNLSVGVPPKTVVRPALVAAELVPPLLPDANAIGALGTTDDIAAEIQRPASGGHLENGPLTHHHGETDAEHKANNNRNWLPHNISPPRVTLQHHSIDAPMQLQRSGTVVGSQAQPDEWDVSQPSRGLGDVIVKITHATGIDRVVKAVTGGGCGCKQRQQALNAAVPFTGMQ